MRIAFRLFLAFFGAILGAELVALPCAALYGHSGPAWPLALLGVLATAGAVIGWWIGSDNP